MAENRKGDNHFLQGVGRFDCSFRPVAISFVKLHAIEENDPKAKWETDGGGLWRVSMWEIPGEMSVRKRVMALAVQELLIRVNVRPNHKAPRGWSNSRPFSPRTKGNNGTNGLGGGATNNLSLFYRMWFV